MQRLLVGLAVIALSSVRSVLAVDGFTVAASSASELRENLFGGYGKIVRVNITNSTPGEPSDLWDGEGRFARISEDGKKVAFIAENRDIMVVNADGSGTATIVAKAANSSKGYLAWVGSSTIYFSDGGYDDDGSKVIRKVSAQGGDAEVVANIASRQWLWSVSKNGTRAVVRPADEEISCGANSMGEVYKVTLPPPSTAPIALGCGDNVVDFESCGNAISPSGNYLCFFPDIAHQKIAVVNWNNPDEVSVVNTVDLWNPPTGSLHNNRTCWSSNSEDWICAHWNLGKQVLLNWRTKEYITVNSSRNHESGDFWVNGSPSAARGGNTHSFKSSSGAHSIGTVVGTQLSVQGDYSSLCLFSLQGKMLMQLSSVMQSRVIDLAALPKGAYLVTALPVAGELVRSQKIIVQ
jgi:Tol biopolymer transport system component